MAFEKQIKALELKIVALGKVASDLKMEQADLKEKSNRTAPANRRNLKNTRLQDFAAFYLKRNIV